jgi:hypothetical protein
MQVKALHKEKELHKSQVQQLREQMSSMHDHGGGERGNNASGPLALRAPSPSAPALCPAAVDGGAAPALGLMLRPVPLDMSLLGDAAAPGTGQLSFADEGPWAAPTPTPGGGCGTSVSLTELPTPPATRAPLSPVLRHSQSTSHLCSASGLPFAGTAAGAPLAALEPAAHSGPLPVLLRDGAGVATAPARATSAGPPAPPDKPFWPVWPLRMNGAATAAPPPPSERSSELQPDACGASTPAPAALPLPRVLPHATVHVPHHAPPPAAPAISSSSLS